MALLLHSDGSDMEREENVEELPGYEMNGSRKKKAAAVTAGVFYRGNV